MRIAALFREGDVRGQCDIPGDLLPCELEGIGGEPHVFAAAGESVGVVRGIVLRRAGVQHRADVSVILKQAEGGRGGLRAEQAGCGKKEEENDAAPQGYKSEDSMHDEKASRASNGKVGRWRRIVNSSKSGSLGQAAAKCGSATRRSSQPWAWFAAKIFQHSG